MTCAKRVVTCELVTLTGGSIFASNACSNPQVVCPRKDGEGYTKCKTVCKQQGHAEEQALAIARRTGIDLRGATAIIAGHYYACEACSRALRDAGVATIQIEVTP